MIKKYKVQRGFREVCMYSAFGDICFSQPNTFQITCKHMSVRMFYYVYVDDTSKPVPRS